VSPKKEEALLSQKNRAVHALRHGHRVAALSVINGPTKLTTPWRWRVDLTPSVQCIAPGKKLQNRRLRSAHPDGKL